MISGIRHTDIGFKMNSKLGFYVLLCTHYVCVDISLMKRFDLNAFKMFKEFIYC